MPSTEIVIVTGDGQRLRGSIRTVEDGPFRGVLLVRAPNGLTQVFDPNGLDHPLFRADRWQNLADHGRVYLGDGPGHVARRQAMARWWRQVARAVTPPRVDLTSRPPPPGPL